jgi:acyl-CoA thioester hydrolase
MGHMNVMWYTGKFDEATWQLFGFLGLTPQWLKAHGRGMAAVEQLTEYRRELHAGDLVSIHTRLLEVKPKALRLRHEMRRDDTGAVAAVCTITALHLDAVLRKACGLPDELTSRWLDGTLAAEALPAVA